MSRPRAIESVLQRSGPGSQSKRGSRKRGVESTPGNGSSQYVIRALLHEGDFSDVDAALHRARLMAGLASGNVRWTSGRIEPSSRRSQTLLQPHRDAPPPFVRAG